MAEKQENPLVAALPPQSDYLTYLTIVEYNLDKSQLDLLHDLLQDTKLTTNIGWDLVHLLLPLLPESEQCLQDIAFLGNPRETILKVAELLERLGQPEGSVAEDDGSKNGDKQVQESDDEEEEEENGGTEQSAQTTEEVEPVDLLSIQFHSLLHMLCILHPRIKTKNPSRFLITSLKAVVNAFRNLQQASEDQNPIERLQSCVRSILMLIKSLSGSKRPNLPPRRSQSAIPTVTSRDAAADPEAGAEAVAPGEAELQKQILQSFATQIIEVYIQSLEPIGTIDSALAWSTRYYERKNPVSGKPKFAEAYEVEEEIDRAEATISQLLSSAENDTQLSWETVLHCVLDEANTDENHKSIFTITDFPASRAGSLYALAARVATSLFNDRPMPFDMSVFPEHSLLTELFVDDLASDIDGDALVVLGKAAFESNGLGDWETRAEFNQYLQRLSQLAASSGLPNVATQASEFTALILHSHPSSDARFDFILDTLKDCPYGELKEAAVFWLRDETSKTFQLGPAPRQEQRRAEPTAVAEAATPVTDFGETSNVFSHPETLKAAAPWVFAKPVSQPQGRTDMLPSTQAKFWLAALNLYYLLCASEILYETLEVHALSVEFNIERDFIAVLAKMVQDSEDAPPETAGEGYGPFLPLIDDALQRLKGVEAKRKNDS